MANLLLHDLIPGTNYNVQVRAVNASLQSEWSPLVTFVATGDTIAPAPPTSLSWTVVGTAFSGTWTAPTTNSDIPPSPLKDLKDYQVTITAGAATAVFYTAATRFDLPFEMNVNSFGSPKATVQISVRARDITGNLSAVVTTSATNPAPAQPANLVATAVNEAISIKWDAVADTDLDHYEVYADTTGAGFTPGPANLVFKGLATNFIYSTFANYSTRYIKVCAVDVFGTQSTFASASATPTSSFVVDTTAPTIPTGLTAVGALDPANPANTTVIATVTWTQTTTADLGGFTIRYRKTGATNWNYLDVNDGSSRAATIPALSAGSAYDFQIKSWDFSQNTAGFTATATMASVADTTLPAAPTGLALVASANGITATWTENTEADVKNGNGTYEVTIATNSGFSTGVLIYNTGANSITVTGLATNTAYWVRVRARDASGNYSAAYSSSATATTGVFPAGALSDGNPPASSPAANVTGGIGNLYVYWTPVVNADLVTYEIHISTSTGFTPSGATKVAENMGTFATLEKDAAGVGLAYGTTYFVKLIAKDRDGSAAAGTQGSGTPVKAGSGDITTVSGAQVKDGVVPTSSPTPNISGGIGYLFAYWTAVANNDQVTYEVHLSTSTGFTPSGATKVFETTDTSAFIRNLPGSSTALTYGTTYYVKLIAKDADGSAAASAQASGIPGKVTSTDSALTAVDVGANKVTYSTSAPGATANNVGDSWFQRDATSGNIVAQFEGAGGTTWTQRKVDTLSIASLAAGQIATGTLSAITITIPATGDIRSADYVAGTTGFKLTSGGLEVRTGTVSANTLVAGTISGQTIQVASTGSVQSTDYVAGTSGFKLSTGGLEIRNGVIAANTITSGTGIVNNLVVNTGGAIQSSNYSAGTAGFKLSNTGLELNSGTVSASALTAGTISAQTISIGIGGTISVDGNTGQIKSNNYAAASTGWRLSYQGLEINDGIIDAKAIKSSTISASTITLGSTGAVQSSNYSAGAAGWQLSSSGLEINGGTIRASALLLQAGENIIPPQYADFEFQSTFYTSGQFVVTNAPTLSIDVVSRFNSQSLKIVAGASVPTIDFTSGATTYNIPADSSTTYIVSAYVQQASGSTQNIVLRFKDNVNAVSSSASLPVPSSGTAWTRVSAIFTTAASATAAWAGIQIPAGVTAWIDGVQVEKQTSAATAPSSWMPPSTTSVDGGMIRTGSIQSTSLVATGQSAGTQPQWSINLAGNAVFANASVRGHLIVGDSSSSGLLTDQYIASANYASGVSGYIVKGDGSVEFNSGTFRGALSVGNNTTRQVFHVDATGNIWSGAAALAGISTPNPSLTWSATGGVITSSSSSGATTGAGVWVTAVDANGNETGAINTWSNFMYAGAVVNPTNVIPVRAGTGVNITYVVTAIGSGGESVGTTVSTSTAVQGSVSLNWDLQAGAYKYRIYVTVGGNAGSYWEIPGNINNAVVFGTGAPAVTGVGSPPASNTSANTATGSFTVSWPAVSGAASYKLYFAPNLATTGAKSWVASIAGTSAVITNISGTPLVTGSTFVATTNLSAGNTDTTIPPFSVTSAGTINVVSGVFQGLLKTGIQGQHIEVGPQTTFGTYNKFFKKYSASTSTDKIAFFTGDNDESIYGQITQPINTPGTNWAGTALTVMEGGDNYRIDISPATVGQAASATLSINTGSRDGVSIFPDIKFNNTTLPRGSLLAVHQTGGNFTTTSTTGLVVAQLGSVNIIAGRRYRVSSSGHIQTTTASSANTLTLYLNATNTAVGSAPAGSAVNEARDVLTSTGAYYGISTVTSFVGGTDIAAGIYFVLLAATTSAGTLTIYGGNIAAGYNCIIEDIGS